MNYIIGIDIGTSNIKAVVITDGGKIIKEFELAHELYSPLPGYSEQDPDEIVASVFSIINRSASIIPDINQLKYISFSAAMHGLLALDEWGKPLTPFVTWADNRAHEIAADLKASAPGKKIYEHTGTPIHPMSPLCKIAWIKKEWPGIFQQATKFVSVKEYLFFKLFGQFVIDHSIASATGLFDITTLDWNGDALSFAGITAGRLSKPVSVATVFKNPCEPYRDQLTIPVDTGFIIGGSDGCLANLGSGALYKNEAAITIGTSGAVRRVSSRMMHDELQRTFQYLLDERSFVIGGAINNGGIALKWFMENFYGEESDPENFDNILSQAEIIPAGAEGLVFLPYVYGERSPVWDAEANGAFVGIRSHHTRAHFLRAVLEGICFSLLQNLYILEESGQPVDTIIASGGFTKSPFWLQLLSDILNKKIMVNNSVDASALGAAFIGLKLMNVIHEWQEVKTFIPGGDLYLPAENLQEIYRHNYAVYAGLYDKLKG
ncbi:MAG TPA: gluconokinase [Chitinophagaceae bacterium]